jgi:hypothetical protein
VKLLLFILGLLLTNLVQAEQDNKDWRQNGTNEEKLDNVIRVIPSAADIMFQMEERYRNLYLPANRVNGHLPTTRLKKCKD